MEIERGKTLCIVGESGYGKSITATSIIQLSPKLSRIEEGEIIYHSEDGRGDIHIERLERNRKQMRSLGGHDVAMILQDPMIALNPVYTIGWQICEMTRSYERVTKKGARARALQLLKNMGVPNPKKRIDQYPHEFSGGIRQRAMIAMTMSCKLKVLIADRPAITLDVTIQAQIFELMKYLKGEYNTAIMLITRGIGVVCKLADDVAVMYMGNIIGNGTAQEILGSPVHLYTKALLKLIPILGKDAKQEIYPIQGSAPDSYDRPSGCQFIPGYEYAYAACDGKVPGEAIVEGTHMVCYNRHKEVLTDAK